MRNISINVPTTFAEAETMAKRHLLNYSSLAGFIGTIFIFILFWDYTFADATQGEQRFTLGFGLVVYGWLAFLAFIGNSADKVNRKWWAWMLTGVFFPVVALIAAIIFRTTKTKA